MSNKINIAIIGAGKWGQTLIKELSTQANILYICHAGNKETVDFLNQNYPNINSTLSLEEVLDDKKVEAIVIATPTKTHHEIASKALDVGKNVFLEKPGCSNSDQLEELVIKSKEKNVIFSVGYEFPYHPIWKKILEMMPLNEITDIRMEWFKFGSFTEPATKNLLCHDISLLLTINKNIEIIDHYVDGVISESDIVYTKFKIGGITSISYINRVSPSKKKTITITGKNATLIWDNNDLFTIDKFNNSLTQITTGETNPIQLEMEDFISSIQTKKVPKTDGDFALNVFKIIEKINP